MKLGADLDRAEPKATADQIKLLTAPERIAFQGFQDRDHLLGGTEAAPALRRLGMTEHLDKMARSVARGDDRFKVVAKAVWDPESGAEGVLKMMNVWGATPGVWQQQVDAAVRNNTPAVGLRPEARDVILEMGGRKWLAR